MKRSAPIAAIADFHHLAGDRRSVSMLPIPNSFFELFPSQPELSETFLMIEGHWLKMP